MHACIHTHAHTKLETSYGIYSLKHGYSPLTTS